MRQWKKNMSAGPQVKLWEEQKYFGLFSQLQIKKKIVVDIII